MRTVETVINDILAEVNDKMLWAVEYDGIIEFYFYKDPITDVEVEITESDNYSEMKKNIVSEIISEISYLKRAYLR